MQNTFRCIASLLLAALGLLAQPAPTPAPNPNPTPAPVITGGIVVPITTIANPLQLLESFIQATLRNIRFEEPFRDSMGRILASEVSNNKPTEKTLSTYLSFRKIITAKYKLFADLVDAEENQVKFFGLMLPKAQAEYINPIISLYRNMIATHDNNADIYEPALRKAWMMLYGTEMPADPDPPPLTAPK